MKLGLNNNQLKIIAMVSMLIDHMGYILFPQYRWMRIVGRLAFPIFAYMIAEGCAHTRNRAGYLFRMVAFAAIVQAAYYVAMDSLRQCCFVTFSMSIATIYAADCYRKNKGIFSAALAGITLAALVYVCVMLPGRLPGFRIEYGLFGVLLPVVIYLVPGKEGKVVAAAAMLMAISSNYSRLQWYALLSLPLLVLYNGNRGKAKLKYLFYIFYPTHLVVLYFIGQYLM